MGGMDMGSPNGLISARPSNMMPNMAGSNAMGRSAPSGMLGTSPGMMHGNNQAAMMGANPLYNQQPMYNQQMSMNSGHMTPVTPVAAAPATSEAEMLQQVSEPPCPPGPPSARLAPCLPA